jgi:hypothetical protein
MLLRKDFYFVNVHTPYEGEIKDTDTFIVFDRIGENLDKLGYSRVSHVAGGMIDWKRQGHEIIEGTPRRP